MFNIQTGRASSVRSNRCTESVRLWWKLVVSEAEWKFKHTGLPQVFQRDLTYKILAHFLEL